MIIRGAINRFGYSGAVGNAEGMAIECEKAGIGCDRIEDVKIDGIVWCLHLYSSADFAGLIWKVRLSFSVIRIRFPVLWSTDEGRHKCAPQVPTVNLRLPTEMAMPPAGVYATRVLVTDRAISQRPISV